MGIEWIEVQYKDKYQDEKRPWYRGLRLVIDREIEEERREKIKAFVAWLKKHYFFPLRCNVPFAPPVFLRRIKTGRGMSIRCWIFIMGRTKKEKSLPSRCYGWRDCQIAENMRRILSFRFMLGSHSDLLIIINGIFCNLKTKSERTGVYI